MLGVFSSLFGQRQALDVGVDRCVVLLLLLCVLLMLMLLVVKKMMRKDCFLLNHLHHVISY